MPKLQYRGRFGVIAALRRMATAFRRQAAAEATISEGEHASAALDAAWYARVYPQVAADIAAGRASSAQDHFDRLGRFRGYLPHRRAARPRDPARPRSAFGGLWTDRGDALDVVEGKRALGFISEAESAQLRAFITDGYVILPGAIPSAILDRADEALAAAYAGGIAGLQFSCPQAGFEIGPWDPRVRQHPAKALEIHMASTAVRDAIFAAPIFRLLSLVFERPPMACQSLGFWRGSAQGLHQDTAYVPFTRPLEFAAAWIALEDVQPGAGELTYRRGSQVLGDFLYAGHAKSVLEARRADPAAEFAAQEAAHGQSLTARSDQAAFPAETFLARRGDVLIWAADLAHGGLPISVEQTRRSIVAHYCPADVAPLYFEDMARPVIAAHESGARYTSFLEFTP